MNGRTLDFNPSTEDLSSNSRSELWHAVWTDRDPDRADWNGFEGCFASLGEYERWTHRVVELLRDRLQLSHSDVVADLGCGTGRIAGLVSEHVRQVLAYDYSETALCIAANKRPIDNVSYYWADLNKMDSEIVQATKAYAVGSLFYLDSEEHVFRLIKNFLDQGIGFAAIDLPDEDATDDLARSYDTSVYTHLRFSAAKLLEHFPTGHVERGSFDDYVHGTSRFNFYVPA